MACRHPKTTYFRWPHKMGTLVVERCVECKANARANGGSNAVWVGHFEAKKHAPGGDIERLPIDPFHLEGKPHNPDQESFKF